jgi:cell division inhibitor SulA/protein ImuA
MSSQRLDELLRHPSVWRAAGTRDEPKALPTGFRRLDERLPGGGWPLDTLIELLLPAPGVGELELLVPAMRAFGQDGAGPRRWIAWLAPPYLPYAPALASAGLDPGRMLVVRPRGQSPSQSIESPDPTLWAMEQALRSRACAAALGWIDAAETTALRRLKLAAEEGGSLGILFRPPYRAREPSPAALRLLLEPRDGALDVAILKCRGGTPGRVEGVVNREG